MRARVNADYVFGAALPRPTVNPIAAAEVVAKIEYAARFLNHRDRARAHKAVMQADAVGMKMKMLMDCCRLGNSWKLRVNSEL